MSFELLFWILMAIWLIFGIVNRLSPQTLGMVGGFGGEVLIFILLGILGWHVFGAPIHP